MAAFAALIVLPLLSGCGYTSKYVAPVDGRARTVWKENQVKLEVAGFAGPDCGAAVAALTGGKTPKVAGMAAPRPGSEAPPSYWVPRYFGPPLVVITPGLAPRPPVPPFFFPHPGHRHPVFAGGYGGGLAPSVSVGGGNDLGKAAAYLAVVLLIALPVLDVSLALASPENGRASQRAIASANAYNDLARQPGTACGPPMGAPQ